MGVLEVPLNATSEAVGCQRQNEKVRRVTHSLSKEHEMHDPDEGILAAFDSIAEASCVFLFIFSLFSSPFRNTTYLVKPCKSP